LFAAGLSQRAQPLMRHYSHNLVPHVGGSINAAQKPLAHRAIGKRLRRQRVVHNHVPDLRIVIRFVERPARDQRCAHSVEISGKHDLQIRRLKLAEVVQCVFLAPAIRKEQSAERQNVSGSHAPDARDRGQRGLHLPHHRGPLLDCAGWLAAHGSERQHALRIKARIDPLQR